jgi:NADH-quinone oxidoreductase subunit A
MGQYLPVVTLFALAAVFAVLSRVASGLLAPSRPTAAKSAPYECGIVPSREPPERFPVRFYLVAMLFIVFDIEIVFLYPYAIVHRELGVFGLVAIVIFAVPVFVSFAYEIANGGLNWGPIRQLRPVADGGMVSAARTPGTTIRRVGLDGRPDAPSEDAA